MSKQCLGRLVGLKVLGLAVYFVCTLCFLASCGDDSSSGSDSKYDMRLCDSSNEGAIEVQDSVSYLCNGGTWIRQGGPDSAAVDTSDTDTLGQDLHQSTGDSVNHIDSAHVDTLMRDTTQSEDSINVDSTGKTAEGNYSLKDAKITGLFGYGILESRIVTVSELDSALNTTGLSFLPTVDSKTGSYSVANVTSEMPYVKVGVHGKIADVVHGVSLSMKDTLSVIVGGSGKNLEANVNVLTFLKSKFMERQLKENGSKTFAEVSKKASDAVWDMFHFDKAELGSVDSVTSIAGIDPGNAALLAVTIMMQAVINDSVANLWKVAADVADGSWDDSLARAKIADWAFNEDVNDNFETVLKNVERLKLGVVPPFEQYIRAFYRAELGIDACSEENAGAVTYSKNKYSAYYASDMSDVSVTADRFICDESTGAWREALDKEKDTYGFEAGQNGETRQGLVNAGIVYTYNEASDSWRVVSSRAERDAYFVKKSAITDFVDIQDVYENIKDDEKVIFLLRHGERDQNATNKDDPLSTNGIKESKEVGAKLKKHKEDFRLGASEFYRAQQTVISIALGRGQDTVVADTIRELNDDWYMVNRDTVNKVEAAVGGWEAIGLYVYNGEYTDDAETVAYYNLKDRSAELIEDVLLAKYDTVPERFIMLSSHDKLMVPFVAYCSDLNINMNLKGGGKWINYLAGIAIIWDKSGNRRYVAFKGLKEAFFQGW